MTDAQFAGVSVGPGIMGVVGVKLDVEVLVGSEGVGGVRGGGRDGGGVGGVGRVGSGGDVG